jgi:hypothetical protein
MIKKIISCFIFVVIINNLSFSKQDSATNLFFFFIGNLLFLPFIANLFENRTGLIQDVSSSHIRLDIGYSPDFLLYKSHNNFFSLGADFHAFGLLFNESKKIILQVDAIDAIFGGHISWKKEYSNFNLSARFRIIHLSSHLVDGRYDLANNVWKDNKLPIAFGREYLDLSICFEKHNFKFIVGSDLIFRQRPNVLSRYNPEASAEYTMKDIIANQISLYLSGHAKLIGVVDKRTLNKNLELGISFNSYKPLSFFLHYYSGVSYYGEYYMDQMKYLGVGFNFGLL